MQAKETPSTTNSSSLVQWMASFMREQAAYLGARQRGSAISKLSACSRRNPSQGPILHLFAPLALEAVAHPRNTRPRLSCCSIGGARVRAKAEVRCVLSHLTIWLLTMGSQMGR